MKIIFMCVMLLFYVSCSKNDNHTVTHQNVFFEYSFINYAWDKSHAGWLIDKSGHIKVYNNPTNWNFPDTNGFISWKDMESNLVQTEDFTTSIDRNELDCNIDLINEISIDSLTNLIQIGTDSGQLAFFCYKFDEKTNRYRQIPLSIRGDFEQTNIQAQGKLLLAWLNMIQKMLE